MNPILLQKQLKENASDLEEFCKDLKSWGDDMKMKEESLRKCTSSSTNSKLPHSNNKKENTFSSYERKASRQVIESREKCKTKSGCIDYSAWDKFDADAECEKIDYDENNESELTDECDETLRDEAYVEKEKGNKFVKNKKWDEAIQCYTKAIDYYSFDPVFYANRALCFLKKDNMVKAEVDCTMSLKLDKTYVKAYQRRAAAREALNKWEEAETDLLKVLELEPKNNESKNNLNDLRKKMDKSQKVVEIEQRPISKFTASRNKRKNSNQILYQGSNNLCDNQECIPQQITDKSSPDWPSGTDNIILVKAVKKPAHLQSKKPLKRIDLQETVDVTEENFEEIKSFPKAHESKMTLKTDDFKIIERKFDQSVNVHEILKETKNYTNTNKVNEGQIELCLPKNSVQFYSQWKHLKTLDDKYTYLKLIRTEELPYIFIESLEGNVFSEILEVLAKRFINNNQKIFNFLWFFSKMRRFSTLTIFMSANDKNYLWKLFDYIRAYEEKPKEEIDELMKKYEL